MSLPARIAVAIFLLAILLFAGFGFLATFEPPGFLVWRIGYSAVILGCLAGIAWLLIWKQKPSQ